MGQEEESPESRQEAALILSLGFDDAAFSPHGRIHGKPCRKSCSLKEPHIKARGLAGRFGGIFVIEKEVPQRPSENNGTGLCAD